MDDGYCGLRAFLYREPTRFNYFKENGFGPFTVQWSELRADILQEAGPDDSIHINGCKGAGKTTLLKLLGKDLTAQGKLVFFFENSDVFSNPAVQGSIRQFRDNKRQGYFLVDETQNNVESIVFTLLLKNDVGHNITTIGAGVPAFQTLSSSFSLKFATDRLFLKNDQLENEGVINYFAEGASEQLQGEIKKLIQHVRWYVGGHVYPLMRITELLLPKMKVDGMNAKQVIVYLNSEEFREQRDFRKLCQRILPPVATTEIRPLLYKAKDLTSLTNLVRTGFCDDRGKIVSHLLLDIHLRSVMPEQIAALGSLGPGLESIKKLLTYGLPLMDWSDYDAHGGPIEDALTFELLVTLVQVRQLSSRLFNPKLIDAGTAARKPDIYLNSSVNSYIECVKTDSNNETAVRSLEEHISRFFVMPGKDQAHYEIGTADFAILHYQAHGAVPMKPGGTWAEIFKERVFTFILSSKKVFLGSTCISE